MNDTNRPSVGSGEMGQEVHKEQFIRTKPEGDGGRSKASTVRNVGYLGMGVTGTNLKRAGGKGKPSKSGRRPSPVFLEYPLQAEKYLTS